MNDLCVDLAIRQRKCQNGISLNTDNIYTNIEDNANLILSYGYILNVVSKNTNGVTISLFNDNLLSTIKFNIPYDTYKTFDLPLYNGTFILLVGAVKNMCTCATILR